MFKVIPRSGTPIYTFIFEIDCAREPMGFRNISILKKSFLDKVKLKTNFVRISYLTI